MSVFPARRESIAEDPVQRTRSSGVTRSVRTAIVFLIVWWSCIPPSVCAPREAHAKDLGDILVEKGIITPAELQEARQAEQEQKAEAEAAQRAAAESKLPKWVRVFTPFGDVRLRHEGFYQQDRSARNRFRFRARIGVSANVSDEASATLRFANGDGDDPISTNQSFGDTFTRKSINLDWAYLTLTPGRTFHIDPGWIAVTAGKFGVNSYRLSELVWDDDVSPEGATETLNVVEQREGFLRGLRVNAFQWVIDEVSDGGDPWMPGGQIVAEAALGTTANWTVAVADYYFDRFNAVARRSLNPYNDPPTNSKANSNYNGSLANSNSVVKDNNGKIVGYKSGFNVLTVATELSAPDPLGVGIPAGLFGEVAYNTRAEGRNVGVYVGAGIGDAGRDWYHARLANPGDWGLSYTYIWVEKDAVLSLFSASDINEFSTAPATAGAARPSQKGATNLSAHLLRLDYVLLPNLQLTAKGFLENVLDRKLSNAPLTGNPTLLRTQLDATVKF
ncbi:MAG: putative porin [Candidatus Binatia bacterium]